MEQCGATQQQQQRRQQPRLRPCFLDDDFSQKNRKRQTVQVTCYGLSAEDGVGHPQLPQHHLAFFQRTKQQLPHLVVRTSATRKMLIHTSTLQLVAFNRPQPIRGSTRPMDFRRVGSLDGLNRLLQDQFHGIRDGPLMWMRLVDVLLCVAVESLLRRNGKKQR